MRKIFTLVLAAAAVFAACQKNEVAETSGDQKVTLNVSLPEVATKANAGEGSAIDELYFELYYFNDAMDYDLGDKLVAGKTSVTAGKATIDFTLMRNTKYRVLFWAQASGSVYGEPANLQAISMNYGTGSTPGNGNDEKRDAFYGTQTFVTDGTVITCDPLKRPFAQLNFLATDFKTGVEYEGIPMGNIELIKTTVEVVTAAPSFNVAKGGPVDGTTPVNAVFEATNFVDVDGNGEVDLYGDPADGNCVISMNYVLPSAATTNVNATFYYQLNNGGSIIPCSPQVYALTNLDLVENFRTNVSGSLFLQGSSYEVSVSSVFDTPDYDEPIL